MVKNAKCNEIMNELYPLAALFIYANNQEITKQKISDIFKCLGVDVQLKLAEMFEFDMIDVKDMLNSITSISAGPATAEAGGAKEESKKEEKEPEPQVQEEFELDFDGLF